MQGLIYGLAPHTFCILFIVFSIAGATVATTLLRRLLYLPYFFQIVIALSLLFAALSAVVYLKRSDLLSWSGIRRKWRYLLTMFGTTLAMNLLLFWVVFPAAANLGVSAGRATSSVAAQSASLQTLSLDVDIPCPGHAPLIIGEVQELAGVSACRYEGKSRFSVTYNPETTSPDQILGLEVFRSFPATSVQ